MKNSKHYLFLLLSFSLMLWSCTAKDGQKVQGDYYNIKIYRLNSPEQTARVEKFLKEAYLPALHRADIAKVGVFKPIESDTVTGNVIFVLVPFKSLDQFEKIPSVLEMDEQFKTAAADYLDAAYNNPPYKRIENILLKAFSEMPEYRVPSHSTPASERIYELRSYEGPTEKMFRKKVEMFNEGGEVKLFEKLGFNAVFYAEVISGSSMPNLMYMTTFSDMKSHDEHWDAFRNDPEWKKLSSEEKYKNTVSASTKYLLHPVDYSDI